MIDENFTYTFGVGWQPAPVKRMADIAAEVAQANGLTLAELKSRNRAQRIAWPRQEAMAKIQQTGRYTLTQIARYFGLDHTTVLYGVRQYEARAAGVKIVRQVAA